MSTASVRKVMDAAAGQAGKRTAPLRPESPPSDRPGLSGDMVLLGLSAFQVQFDDRHRRYGFLRR